MKILLLNQTFHPDHVATAQVLTDFALALVGRGHEVTAVASSRGYDDAALRYPIHQMWRGVRIERIWTPGLGKKSKWRRAVDFGVFWISAAFTLLRLPRADVTVCLTSPPLISSLGTLVTCLKGGAVVPWIMDLNPDEAVAAGWLRAGSVPERVMTALQNWSFGRAARIIALDRFMAERLRAKGVAENVIFVMPPWSHDDAVRRDEDGRAAFRRKHGLEKKFVVMYSGNHSPCHPLDTILEAASRISPSEDIRFVFVGGGSEFQKVREFASKWNLPHITCLPYQPMETLSASLSSADLHLVVMGDAFVGMVHPCKVYNILALGIPFLFVGPAESHVGDLARRLDAPDQARMARHGDAEEIALQIRAAAARGPSITSASARALGDEFSQRRLCPRLLKMVEEVAGL